MTGKMKMILIWMATMILMSAVPAMAKEKEMDNCTRFTVGCAGMMNEYYDQVNHGKRLLYHYRTQQENLDSAKEEMLESYQNLGIVDLGSGYLNVRRTPSEKGNIIGKMTDGCAGEILEEKDGWYHISSGGVDGYVKKKYIKTGAKAKKKALKKMELCVQITTDTLNVRTEPREDAKKFTHVSRNERYAVIADMGDWIQIELDTSVGYVAAEYVKVAYSLESAIEVEEKVVSDSGTATGSRQDIVDYAMQFLGNPYVWGGESLTNGVDCSGFTMQIYRKFGISLPHYSVDQSKKGRSISSSEMKKGDLIFYAGSDGTINHVTMYIGNGQIIGAQSRRTGITIKSWDYRTPVKIISLLD